LTDLDESPDLITSAFALVQRTARGRDHIVAGDVQRIGRKPTADDFVAAAGVLVAVHGEEVVGVLALYHYGDEQMTIWGPGVHPGWVARGVGTDLWLQARRSLAEAGYISVRTVVDERNRGLRGFWLARGMRPWKDNLFFQKNLVALPAEPGVFLGRRDDHAAIEDVLAVSFPDASHLDRSLLEREREGYRYWVLQDGGSILAAAAVIGSGKHRWLHLLAVSPQTRGRGVGHRLLQGILAGEYDDGGKVLTLEVLADNRPACALYESHGMHRRWSTRVLTGPVVAPE
jgi:ribosomal protein S18 acetylase RimI-like enzyme